MTSPPKSSPNADLPKRKLKSWLTTYLKTVMPISMAPESFLIWSGMFCIASVCKRKIRFSRDYTKIYTIYPTLYTMFVSPPGVATKTTMMGFAEDIIRRMNVVVGTSDLAHVNIGPSSGSASKIIEMMAGTLDGSMTIFAGEFGDLVKIQPEVTYDFFAKMFDHDQHYSYATRQHNVESVINPSLNIFGCTTPDWMAFNTGYMSGGGFAARVVFVFENQPRQRKMFYDDVGEDFDELEKIKDNLAHDLSIIGQLKGDFKPSDKKLRNKIEDWFQSYGDEVVDKSQQTFRHRKHVHVIRTAMLLSLSESNSLVINEHQFDAAVELCDNIERKLTRGLIIASKNPYIAEHYKILDYIVANGPITRNKVHAAFWQDVKDPNDFAAIIEVLLATGEIEEVDFGFNDRRLRQTKVG